MQQPAAESKVSPRAAPLSRAAHVGRMLGIAGERAIGSGQEPQPTPQYGHVVRIMPLCHCGTESAATASGTSAASLCSAKARPNEAIAESRNIGLVAHQLHIPGPVRTLPIKDAPTSPVRAG